MFPHTTDMRSYLSRLFPGHIFQLTVRRPHMRKIGLAWYCEGNRIIGWGKTWREAYANWQRELEGSQSTPTAIPTFTYSWWRDYQPGEVIEISANVPKPTGWQRALAWFDRTFGDRA